MSSDRKRVPQYPEVLPDIHKWPITTLSTGREPFVKSVQEETFKQLEKYAEEHQMSLHNLIEKTRYLERIRMRKEPWKIDPKSEQGFWGGKVKNALIQNNAKLDEQTLNEILHMYADEIAGKFEPKVYNFARTVVPFWFAHLFNALSFNMPRRRNRLTTDRVKLCGHIDEMRNLVNKGTVLLLPTHFSNLDSILIGWALQELGMPGFIYGAGLNLFNNRILGWFMNRLGAYKVDRRKKNPIYLETLKTYSTLALEHGAHSLFFPGGTRSRSGALESRLKLGLLGTAFDAQRKNFEAHGTKGGKIYVVPLVISYHFVLEAATLIKEHLKRAGEARYYLEEDEFSNWGKLFHFVWKFFSVGSKLALTFGKPMDLFGNFVDAEGRSFDERGNHIELRRYFMTRGKITLDPQRDSEYTRMLSEVVVDRFHAENRVFSSHLVAFTGFELLKRHYKELDLFSLLRLPPDDAVRGITEKEFYETVERLLQRLRDMSDQGKLHLADNLGGSVPEIVEHGIKYLRGYHHKFPLIHKDNFFTSQDLNLLYYYHNRLTGYELEAYV